MLLGQGFAITQTWADCFTALWPTTHCSSIPQLSVFIYVLLHSRNIYWAKMICRAPFWVLEMYSEQKSVPSQNVHPSGQTENNRCTYEYITQSRRRKQEIWRSRKMWEGGTCEQISDEVVWSSEWIRHQSELEAGKMRQIMWTDCKLLRANEKVWGVGEGWVLETDYILTELLNSVLGVWLLVVPIRNKDMQGQMTLIQCPCGEKIISSNVFSFLGVYGGEAENVRGGEE